MTHRIPPYDDEAATQRYLNYMATFRQGNYDILEVHDFWDAKTPLQRARLDDVIERLVRESNAYDRTHVADAQGIEEALNLARQRLHDLRRLDDVKNGISDVVQPIRDMFAQAQGVRALWREMCEVENDQHASSDDVNRHHAESMCDMWDIKVGMLQAEAQEIDEFLCEDQQPPLNVRGKARIPRSWVRYSMPDDRARVRSEAAQYNGELGMPEPRHGFTWVAWQDLSGGMSSGCLWICFDRMGT